MRSKRVLLGGLLGVRAIAAPRGFAPIGIVPFRNTTTTSQSPSTTAACAAQCSVVYPPLSAIQWIPESQIVYTEKVVVATVVVTIVTSGNSTLMTRTGTSYDEVRGQSLYQLGTNYDGTVELTLTIPQRDGVNYYSTLTYPTPYLDYDKEYHWQGVLPTNDKDLSSTCATATEPANVPLPSHPEYPQPKGEFSPGRNDPYGAGFQPLYVAAKDEPDGYWFQLEFSSEAAFSSCESISADVKIPTQYEAALFITETTTTTVGPTSTTLGIVIVQPSATGWEVTTTSGRRLTPAFPHQESTASNWIVSDSTQSTGGGGDKPLITPDTPVIVTPPKTPVANIMSSATGLGPGKPSVGDGQAQQSNDGGPAAPPRSSQNFGDAIASIINNNPQFFPPGATRVVAASQFNPNPGITPAPANPFAPGPTPVFTLVPTVINGVPTSAPAFILPGSSETATIGQTVTVNGQPTVLAAPSAFFTEASTTINGVATSAPVFIIDGTNTATLGQTVTFANGQTTVLSPPAPFFTVVPTTINGVATSISAFIIDGTSTATLGQTVTLANGQTTVLTAPTAVLSWISTTDAFGNPTSVPVYLIDGTSTATAGQTLVINGSTTILPTPTATDTVNSELGGPVNTKGGGQATATGAAKGSGNGVMVGCNAIWLGFGVVVLLL